MRVAVVGAGIVGVATAYELASDGHTVTVFERGGTAALESSFAQAGVLSGGCVIPWNAAGMPARLLRSVLARHAAARPTLPLSTHELKWLMRWILSCGAESSRNSIAIVQRLAQCGQRRLNALTHRLRLEFDRSAGFMTMLRTPQECAAAAHVVGLLRDAGVNLREIDQASARSLEPAINPDTAFSGAVHFPDGEVANCRQFALLLKTQAQALGVTFEFGTDVLPIDPATPTALRVARGVESPTAHPFDAVAVCSGAASADLLRGTGLRLPLVRLHGCSISAPIREPLNAPRSGLMDERYRVAITRLGNRVRITGGAELGGQPLARRSAVRRTLYKVLHDWFPGAAQLASGATTVQEWCGSRATSVDGAPLVGASGMPGVWLNTGHGDSGWAVACGSARVLADLLSGRATDIDATGLGIDRLQR